MSVVGNSTIRPVQGSQNTSAGNVSDHTYTNDECEFFVDLNSPLYYSYYWYPTIDSTHFLYYYTDTLNKITIVSSNDSNLCQSNLDNGIQPISVIQARRLSLTDEINNQQTRLAALVDGGNTQALLDEVNNLTQRNYLATCADLLAASPYLSDTVLKVFMFNPLRRPIAKTLVLLANSPLPVAVRYRIDETNLGYWFRRYLKQFQTGTNPREAKEMEIADLKTENNRLLYRIVAYGNFMADSLPVYADSVEAVLDDEPGYAKYKYLIPMLINRHRFEEATAAINDLETYANTLDGTQRDNLLATCDYLRIVKRYVKTGYGLDVVKQYSPQLEAWATDDNSPVQIPAQLLLEQGYPEQFDYPEKIELPEKKRNKSLQINVQDITEPAMTDKDDMLLIYPNPSDNQLTVEYLNITGNKNQTVSIYDMQGHKLKSLQVQDVLGVITFDVSDLPSGDYIISIGEFTKQITILH